jgi:hypothetical protein
MKAFLCHSSHDKDWFVKFVADRLGKQSIVYDEYSFEEGGEIINEILSGIDQSQLFVAFLSVSSVESKWVQTELFHANKKLQEKTLSQILPIIIDSNLLHTDPRIPDWLRERYNLKYISQPSVVVRRIRQHLREIYWERYPSSYERSHIFVGRNQLIADAEQRIDDFEKGIPACIIASGLPRIGRSSILKSILMKSNLYNASDELRVITLTREDSVEDLILRIYDLGILTIEFPKDLMRLSRIELYDLCYELLKAFESVSEILLIRDEGCLINYQFILQEWFINIISRFTDNAKPICVIASKYYIKRASIRRNDNIYAIQVPELSVNERQGLFRRLLDANNISISKDDFETVKLLFSGYPDQIYYAVEKIIDSGIKETIKQSHEIADYNTHRADIVMQGIANESTKELIVLLAEFDFVSLDVLDSIVSGKSYESDLELIIASGICEYIGVEREYIKLSDIVRDYIRRNQLEVSEEYRAKLSKHVNNFLNSPESEIEESDISNVIYSLKEGLKEGKEIPKDLIIPTLYLKSIKELYEKRHHLERVIQLADRVLENKDSLEPNVENNIRYYLCLTLARLRQARVLSEVNKLQGFEHNFVLGYYFRKVGNYKLAIEEFKKCADAEITGMRAKRELVQVYIGIGDYDSAFSLAESNYNSAPFNPYFIQNYFNVVINSHKFSDEYKADILEELITKLRSIDSEVSKQMAIVTQAEYDARVLGNKTQAYNQLIEAIDDYPDLPYPALNLAFLSVRFNDLDMLDKAYRVITHKVDSHQWHVSDNSFTRIKCYKLAMGGNVAGAKDLARKYLKQCPQHVVDRFLNELDRLQK